MDDFEAEVKKVKPERKPNEEKAARQQGAKRQPSREPDEDSPLKTPGGTPIIERPPEG